MIDAAHGIGAIGAIFEVTGGELFTGVGVVEGERATGVVRRKGGPSCRRQQVGGQKTGTDFNEITSTAVAHGARSIWINWV